MTGDVIRDGETVEPQGRAGGLPARAEILFEDGLDAASWATVLRGVLETL